MKEEEEKFPIPTVSEISRWFPCEIRQANHSHRVKSQLKLHTRLYFDLTRQYCEKYRECDVPGGRANFWSNKMIIWDDETWLEELLWARLKFFARAENIKRKDFANTVQKYLNEFFAMKSMCLKSLIYVKLKKN